MSVLRQYAIEPFLDGKIVNEFIDEARHHVTGNVPRPGDIVRPMLFEDDVECTVPVGLVLWVIRGDLKCEMVDYNRHVSDTYEAGSDVGVLWSSDPAGMP